MIVGAGFTVIVKVITGELQVPKLATTETVATTGLAVLFVAVNDGNPPVPDAAKPMLVLLLVQEKVAAAGVPVNVCAGTTPPEQTVIGGVVVTVAPAVTTTEIVCRVEQDVSGYDAAKV